MNRERMESEERKKYEPPQLTTISLRPEEAVLGHCKTLSTGGSQGSSCSNFFAPCVQTVGS
jgi:hypothetical protein